MENFDDDISLNEFGSSLTVKDNGVLTVNMEFLKNGGMKFLDLMERLAKRDLQSDKPSRILKPDFEDEDSGVDDDDDDDFDEDEDDNPHYMNDDQRMEQGRKMFQIFAAKMFECRVLDAYKDKLASDRAASLVQELEEAEIRKQEKKKRDQKKRELEKAKKREKQEQELLLKEQEMMQKKQEAERLRLEKEEKENAIRYLYLI